MAVNNVSDRNYMDLLGSANSDKPKVENLAKKYGIEYTTGNEGNLGFEDFLTLMIKQLTNQDFTNPTDDSEFMTQMTQYSTLQAMQEMAKYSQSNYAMSMIGKTVSASKYSNGNMISETGVVTEVKISDGDYEVVVNGKSFSMKQINSVGTGESTSSAEESSKKEETSSSGTAANGTQADTQSADSTASATSSMDEALFNALSEAAMG